MFSTLITLLLSKVRVVTLEGCTRPLNSFDNLLWLLYSWTKTSRSYSLMKETANGLTDVNYEKKKKKETIRSLC